MAPPLSAHQSRMARKALGLSQNKAANGAGINRSQLALFEVQKYLLDDELLQKLRHFYQEQGYHFESAPQATPGVPLAVQESGQTTHSRADAVLIDGFLVPAGLDHDEVEEALAEIEANDEAIQEIAAGPVEEDWWSGESGNDQRDPALVSRTSDCVYILMNGGRDGQEGIGW